MKTLKGKSAEGLRAEFPELRKRYWGMHMWARGYFVSTVGIDSEIIKKYVKEQEDSEIKANSSKPPTRSVVVYLSNSFTK